MQAKKSEKSKVGTAGSDDFVNIKVRRSTREKLYSDLKKIKQIGGSRKVILDEIICLGRDAVTDTHIEKFCHSTRTNEDKEKLIFEIYKAKHKGATLDEFKGKLILGELTDFIRENCQDVIVL